jgi:hypothetical protein
MTFPSNPASTGKHSGDSGQAEDVGACPVGQVGAGNGGVHGTLDRAVTDYVSEARMTA